MTAHNAELDAPDPSRDEVAVLRAAIDAAHDEQRQALDAGRGDETMTLFQHWSATAGWLASRIRQIECVGEADWPDAMRTTPEQASGSELDALVVCDEHHGSDGNAATVYGHHGSARTCLRLFGTATWIYDPRWEAHRG